MRLTKSKFLIGACLMLPLMQACGDDDSPAQPIHVDKTLLVVDAVPATHTIGYYTTQEIPIDRMEVSTDDTWIHIVDVTSADFSFDVDANTSTEQRTGAIYVTYRGNSETPPITIAIRQDGIPTP